MKSLFLDKNIKYDGEQLRPLFNYLNYGVLGHSMVSWVGPCEVTPEHMIDGEDLLAQSKIASDEMVHFVAELFDFPLKAMILLQRMMAEMTLDILKEHSSHGASLVRKGDDIYWNEKKLNISIATISSNSSLLHFAVNTKNSGAPVPVCSLADFDLKPKIFAEKLLAKVVAEVEDVIEASQKVIVF